MGCGLSTASVRDGDSLVTPTSCTLALSGIHASVNSHNSKGLRCHTTHGSPLCTSRGLASFRLPLVHPHAVQQLDVHGPSDDATGGNLSRLVCSPTDEDSTVLPDYSSPSSQVSCDTTAWKHRAGDHGAVAVPSVAAAPVTPISNDSEPILDAESYAQQFSMYCERNAEYRAYMDEWERHQTRLRLEREGRSLLLPPRSMFTREQSGSRSRLSRSAVHTPMEPGGSGSLLLGGQTALGLLIEQSRFNCACTRPVAMGCSGSVRDVVSPPPQVVALLPEYSIMAEASTKLWPRGAGGGSS